MTPTPGKFPRRYAQRQALRLRKKISDDSPRSRKQQGYKQRVGKQSDSSSQPECDSDSDVDMDGEEKDSGYGSDTDDEADLLNEMVEQFRQMGPQVSNLGEVAKQMIQTEMDMFKR
jgi:hypothetical protein